MGKKQRSTGSGAKDASRQHSEREEQTKYGINEDFADSEDEFFAERDHVLLEDGPSNKRRKVDKDGQ